MTFRLSLRVSEQKAGERFMSQHSALGRSESSVSRFTCESGAVFLWTRETANGKGVIGGRFEISNPTAADIDEVKAFLNSQMPEDSEKVFEKVIAGPASITAQQVRALKDGLLGQGGRN